MSGSTRTFGILRCGRDSIEKKSSTTPIGSSRSISGVPSGPNGLDQVRITGTPSGTTGRSTESGTRRRSRLRYPSPSRITASEKEWISAPLSTVTPGPKKTFGSMVTSGAIFVS